MAAIKDEREYEDGEQKAVREHKYHRLLRAGYSHFDASYLAELDVDIHRLDALIKQGCDRDIAARFVS